MGFNDQEIVALSGLFVRPSVCPSVCLSGLSVICQVCLSVCLPVTCQGCPDQHQKLSCHWTLTEFTAP